MVPRESSRRLRLSCREIVVGQRSGGGHFRMNGIRSESLHAGGRSQVESPDGGIHIVAREVRKRSAAEGPEVAPGKWSVGRMEWPPFARAEPQIPIQSGWNRFGI